MSFFTLCIIFRAVLNATVYFQSVEGEPHEKAVELLKAAQGKCFGLIFFSLAVASHISAH